MSPRSIAANALGMSSSRISSTVMPSSSKKPSSLARCTGPNPTQTGYAQVTVSGSPTAALASRDKAPDQASTEASNRLVPSHLPVVCMIFLLPMSVRSACRFSHRPALGRYAGASAPPPSLVEDEAKKIQQDLGREDRRDSGGIVGRRDLDEVDSHHVAPHGQPLQELQHLPVEESAVARRAGARRNRRIEGVDVDRDIVADAGRDQLQHARGAEPPELPYRTDSSAAAPGVLIAFAGGR